MARSRPTLPNSPIFISAKEGIGHQLRQPQEDWVLFRDHMTLHSSSSSPSLSPAVKARSFELSEKGTEDFALP